MAFFGQVDKFSRHKDFLAIQRYNEARWHAWKETENWAGLLNFLLYAGFNASPMAIELPSGSAKVDLRYFPGSTSTSAFG